MTAVSVLMTAFNAGRHLAEAVDSIIAQDHDDWELVLIDNGSTDNAVDPYVDTDPRIRVTTLPHNIGRTPALQLALETARHPYVAILDADDVCRPDRLSVQSKFLDRRDATVLVGSCVDVIDAESRVTGELCLQTGLITHDALAERNVFVNSSVMFRRSSAVEVGGYDSSFPYAQDYHLFLRLASVGDCHILEDHFTGLRILATSVTRSGSANLSRAVDEATLFALAPSLLRLTPHGKRLNRRRQAISTLFLGCTRLRRGQMRRGLADLVKGACRDPRLSWVPYMIRHRRSNSL